MVGPVQARQLASDSGFGALCDKLPPTRMIWLSGLSLIDVSSAAMLVSGRSCLVCTSRWCSWLQVKRRCGDDGGECGEWRTVARSTEHPRVTRSSCNQVPMR